MYSESYLRDCKVFAKACTSNLLARLAPGTYVRLTGQTGRGSDDDDVEQIAEYFERSFTDYRDRLQLDDAGFAAFLQGRRVLEYGPGDILGVALLMYAAGADHVHCVDRFPLENVSAKNARVYQRLLDRMTGPARHRASAAFVQSGQPLSGFRRECVDYRVTCDGLAARAEGYDFIISRAVLEHVNSLEGTLADVELCLARGGVSVHNVDLRSHNLDRYRPYDFLTWPSWAYRLMYSHKGFPNRWRPGRYRDILASCKLKLRAMEPTGKLPTADIARIRPHLAVAFAHAEDDDLSWLGFWMILESAR